MLLDVRPAWVIQQKSSGCFLNDDLFLVRSFRFAGRCYDYASAIDTAQLNFGDDYEIHQFYETDKEQRALF